MNQHSLLENNCINYDFRTPKTPIAIRGGTTLCWQQLFTDVHTNNLHLQTINATEWALFHDDSYLFLVGLLSLLSLKKTVHLPSNNLAGTVTELQGSGLTLLGQFSGGLAIQDNSSLIEKKPIKLTGKIIIFTSGSTGEAKKIPKSLQQLTNEIQALDALWGKAVNNSAVLSTVSHQHIYGLLFKILWPFFSGRPFITKTYRDPATLLADSALYKRAIWVASPAHLNRYSAIWPWEKATQHLCKIFSSGGPLTLETATQIQSLHGSTPVEIFGSSESGGIAWRMQKSDHTYWRPLPKVEFQTNNSGALEIRSPHLENQQWLTMEDSAKVLPNGYFLLGDRLDRIVKIEEKRVSLPEVERRLEQHSWVASCRALTIKRQRTTIAAAVILTDSGLQHLAARGKHATSQQLKNHLKEYFDAVTLPRFWRFPRHMPMNVQGKIRQQDIEALFINHPVKLLPTEISVQHSENKCAIDMHVNADISYFNGHFSDFPIVPGVVQIGWAEHWGKQVLGIEGCFLTMEAIKFKQFIRPDTLLTLELEYKAATGKLNFLFRSKAGEHSFGRLLFEYS